MAWPACILSLLLTILLVLVQSSSISAQNTGNIPVGRSLSATNSSSWLSSSGDFAFGFSKFPNSTSLFLLAIWYAKIPDTIVWYGNDGNPVPQGSSVKITADEGLVLSDPQGNKLWDTSDELSDGGDVSYGFMNDTGNFALKRSNNDNSVWQSFNYPTDTLLPSQFMDITGVVNSRRSETNFTKGMFQLRLIPDGNLVLNNRELVTGFAYGAYYTSGTNDPANSVQKLIYNESGYMYLLREDGSRYDLLPQNKMHPSEKYYQRATLNFDGILIWYYILKSSISNGWFMAQALPDNICMTNRSPDPDLGSGSCGFNSICSHGDNKRPTCTCPQGYSLLDPGDQYSSCKPDFKLDGCERYAEKAMKGAYKLIRLPITDWPFNDYERLDPSNEEDCKNSCLKDCFCAAANFNDNGCSKKKAPLSNGRKDTTVRRTTWIKVGNLNYTNDLFKPNVSFPPPSTKNKVKLLSKVLFGGSISVNILLLSAIGLGIFFIYHKKQLKVFDVGQTVRQREYSNIHCFGYQELNEATNEFKEELGRGSFGIVYKGMINKGDTPVYVAVKKLDRISSDTDKEFKTEVNVIGRTHHKNLVQLVGFCKEQDQRLLVYEYMCNGSLADYLFGDSRPRWVDRVQIAQGISKGLLYLHEECSTQIIHCDIKPQNIILDEYQNARISDFGLAKLLVLNQTYTNTAIRGTKGYVAPEWFRNKPVTVKVDVYSFGVLLLEIICCRRSVCMKLIEEEAAILTDWAFDCYQTNRLDSLVNDDMEALNDIAKLKRFVTIALWCIQEDPSLRPTMRMVTQMLEGLAEVPNNPPGPTSFSVTTQS
ncbi:hypothetical protein BVRB_4g079680 [Beta vulgaris subsp. vulgaris]|nr:hypothetical protein BVRB_4g079680 [Beta vulgaris subsp. vulgaris]